jgi:O-acetyl-ADP-ribose deacetylase (regulator of RNase III)
MTEKSSRFCLGYNRFKLADMSQLLKSLSISPKVTLEIRQGDLTTEQVDAIVNAANQHLAHGGGVAGAIVQVGGWVIQEESTQWVKEHGIVTHEKPAYTSAGRLPCRVVIHAVGPVWGEGDEDRKLAAAVTGSLELADHLGLKSIAFPAISTGIFSFPKERAAGVILLAIRGYFTHESSINDVRIILVDTPTIDAFLSEIKT